MTESQSMTIDGLEVLQLILDTINSDKRHYFLLSILTGDIKLTKNENGIKVSPCNIKGAPIGAVEVRGNFDDLPEEIEDILSVIQTQLEESKGPEDFFQRLKLAFSESNGKPN